ncbi:Trichodiene oxygenase [Naviculisporaceae sp. PSN 640]
MAFPSLTQLFQSLTTTSTLLWCVVGYLGGLVLYRLYLSPLARARVPGPKLAALTFWYECYYDVIQPAQYVFKIKEMHAKYGPIIRTSPTDISISDPDFIDTIYAPGPGHKRDKDYEKNKALGVDSSVGGSITHDLHRRRREALNPFFSARRIHQNLDAELRDRTKAIENALTKAANNGEVVNLSDVYFAFANDIVHNYCFGNNPDLLSNLELANTRRTNVAAVLRSVKVMLHFGWIRDIMELLPLSIRSGMTPPGVRDMITFRSNIRTQIDRLLSPSSSSKVESEKPSIFTHLRDSPSLPGPEKSAQRLEDEATLMTMAGSYSPMLSLVTAHYYIVSRPDILSKLRAELDSHGIKPTHLSSTNITELEQLPYLNGIIHESHRLTFGLTGRNPRQAPDETLFYTNPKNGITYSIPPGTSVAAPTLVVHTDETLFPDPWRFDPERWITGPGAGQSEREIARRKKAMLGFGKGPRQCIGLHLTNAEMTMALAAAAGWDMELFETGEEDVKFLHDYHVLCPRLDTKGVRVKVLGRRGV